MAHVIEPASTGRAKCRGCGERIATGVLRFGESLPNPFADGETTHWFHPECAAFKRPERFLETLEARSEPIEDTARLKAAAQDGITHRRLPRASDAERAPSGRAQCRSCHSSIEKGAWRIPLVFYEEGRFAPAGYIHVPCAQAYLETTDVISRLKRFSPALSDEDVTAIAAQLRAIMRAG
jgi:hypothetical protein